MDQNFLEIYTKIWLFESNVGNRWNEDYNSCWIIISLEHIKTEIFFIENIRSPQYKYQ